MNSIKDILQKYMLSVLAIDEDGNSYSYSQALSFARNIGQVYRERPLVFCLAENSIGSLMGYLSFMQNRWVVLMLDAKLDSELLQGLVGKYQPNLIWMPDSRVQEFANAKLIYQDYGYSLIELNSDQIHLHTDLGLLLTTSGSTGSPKLVRLSYQNLLANASSIAEYLDITAEERPITSLPMYYSFGLSVINSHIIKGATLLLSKRGLMEKEFWNMLKEQKVTSMSGVPYTFEMLHRLRFQRMNLPDLRTITQAGGKLNDNLIEFFALHAQKTGQRFFVMYGQTEATARMSYLPYQQTLDKIGSIGIPIPGGRFMLMDDLGNEITETGKSGELVYFGENVSLGYAESQDDLSLGDENQGCLATGDIAQVDSDGYYYIVGRKKRFIKIFGNRVNLDASEQLLKAFYPDIVCTGRDDKMYIYTLESGKEDEIRSFIAHKLGIHISAFVVRQINEIPKNNSGKVLYAHLSIE